MDVSSIHSIRGAFSRAEICYFDEFVFLILFWFCARSTYKRTISLQIPSVAMPYSHWNDSGFQKKIKVAFFANNRLGRQSLKGQIKINWRRIKQANRFGEQSASAYAKATLLSMPGFLSIGYIVVVICIGIAVAAAVAVVIISHSLWFLSLCSSV